jgi:hypothetical protein
LHAIGVYRAPGDPGWSPVIRSSSALAASAPSTRPAMPAA